MLENLRAWAVPWGDLASVAGFLTAVVGFIVTIIGVYRSKSAAQRAREAADATRALLVQSNVIADFAAALTIMAEIRRLQLAGAWAILPDRYSSLREKLKAIEATRPGLTDPEKLSMGEALTGMQRLQYRVELSHANNGAPPNTAKLNQIIG